MSVNMITYRSNNRKNSGSLVLCLTVNINYLIVHHLAEAELDRKCLNF